MEHIFFAGFCSPSEYWSFREKEHRCWAICSWRRHQAFRASARHPEMVLLGSLLWRTGCPRAGCLYKIINLHLFFQAPAKLIHSRVTCVTHEWISLVSVQKYECFRNLFIWGWLVNLTVNGLIHWGQHWKRNFIGEMLLRSQPKTEFRLNDQTSSFTNIIIVTHHSTDDFFPIYLFECLIIPLYKWSMISKILGFF